jgi:hypothetical protein
MNPIITKTFITTATFQDNDRCPGTDYGDDIPVEIVSHREDGDDRSITVKIGKYMFPLSELQRIMDDVEAHNAAVAAGNKARRIAYARTRTLRECDKHAK